MAQSCVGDAATAGSSSGSGRMQHRASTEPPQTHPPRKALRTGPRSTVLTRAAALLPFSLIVLLFDPMTTILSPLPALASPVFTSTSASRRLLQTTTNPPPPPPGPSCVGQCCSNRPPPSPSTPTMTSEWLSAQMAHGAKIQIRAVTWNTFWAISTNPLYNNTIQCESNIKPKATTFFTVQRVSTTMIRLIAPDGRFVRAAPAGLYPNIMGRYGAMDLTANASDPQTVLRVEPMPGSSTVVFFRSNADGGGLLSSSGSTIGRWNWGTGREWERWEIREVTQVPAIRGANLGSWLVYESWMNPTFGQRPPWFSVDGALFGIRNTLSGLWASAANGSLQGGPISVDLLSDLDTARFAIWLSPRNSSNFMVRTQYLHFWELQPNGTVVATKLVADNASVVTSNMDFTFFIQNRSDDCWLTKVLIRAPNGMFLRAPARGSASMGLVADVAPSSINMSSDAAMFADGPAVFWFTRYGGVLGDWQVSLSAGGKAASTAKYQTLWSSLYTEADWQAMQARGINAVRIPIGYWILADNTTLDTPYPEGGTAVLDWAFSMGLKYGVRIWLSMHGVWGSQSGWGNTGARGPFIKFGNEPGTVERQLAFLDRLGQRYGSHPMWIGIGLANEPIWEGFVGVMGVPLPALQDYYTRAYDVIRKYAPCTFIAMEGRKHLWEVHWLMWDNWHTNLVLEAHIYAVFAGIGGKTPADDIAWMRDWQTNNIAGLQKWGRALVVGEFCNAMANPDYKNDTWQQAYSLTQMQTLAKAGVGWFFWAYKHNITLGYQHWSFVASDARGWLPKAPSGTWY